MSADYTGLHGRSPWNDDDHEKGDEGHFPAEGWEELDRGICALCGRTVSWNHEAEEWVIDPSLTVLVLTEDEVRSLPRIVDTALAETIDRQYDLNRPIEEVIHDGDSTWTG